MDPELKIARGGYSQTVMHLADVALVLLLISGLVSVLFGIVTIEPLMAVALAALVAVWLSIRML